jgi:hypothetical protein
VVLLVETVGNRSSHRLIDNSENVHSRDGSGILGGLPLRVVEIGRDGDDRAVDGCSEVGFVSLLHLKEYGSTPSTVEDNSWVT